MYFHDDRCSRLDVFFDAECLIHYELIPEGHNVNKKNLRQNPPSRQGCNEKEMSRKMEMKQLISFA
jgi:hypothetical protein